MTLPARKTKPLLNIGPVGTGWLKNVGVVTYADLKRQGPKKVFEKLLAAGYPANKNMWYSLVGAYLQVHWSEARERVLKGEFK